MTAIPAARLLDLPFNNRDPRRHATVTEPTDVEIAVWLLGPLTQDSFPKWAFKLCKEGARPLSLFRDPSVMSAQEIINRKHL